LWINLGINLIIATILRNKYNVFEHSTTRRVSTISFLRLLTILPIMISHLVENPTIAFHSIELVHRTRRITRGSGRLSTTWQRAWRLTSTSLPRPHYELLCCAGDYGGAAGGIEDLGSPGVSPLPSYYEQSPIATTGTVQKGRPRKRKLSEVTGSELPVTMRLTAGALGESSQCMFRDLVRSWTNFLASVPPPPPFLSTLRRAFSTFFCLIHLLLIDC